MSRSANSSVVLGQCRKLWANIKPTLDQSPVFAGLLFQIKLDGWIIRLSYRFIYSQYFFIHSTKLISLNLFEILNHIWTKEDISTMKC